MNATPHTLAGVISIASFPDNLPLGCLVATCSHFLLDYINESGLTFIDRIIYDVIPSVLLILYAIFTGNLLLLLLGNIFGNLPDIIDKKGYLTIIFPDKFKNTEYLHWQKVLVNPKPIVTKAIGVISLVILIIILI